MSYKDNAEFAFAVRTEYSQRDRIQVINNEPSLTKQSFADEVNVNNIITKYGKTGLIDHINSSSPNFDDVSDIADYASALSVVMKAENAFMSLPANIRARFGNDPAEYVRFFENPDNKNEAIKLGLIKGVPKDEENIDINSDERRDSPDERSFKGKATGVSSKYRDRAQSRAADDDERE